MQKPAKPKVHKHVMAHIRRYLLSGLLFWLPIWITIMIVRFFLGLLDLSLAMLPAHLQPDALIGFHIPGLNIFIIFLILFISGVLVANIIGKRLVKAWDNIIARIPLVRSIYAAVKQTIDTIFSSTGQSFRKVLLVEYPRAGAWSVAFQTGDGTAEVRHHLKEESMVTVFVPTTPNPTSGFLIMLPKSEVIELNMTVEQALKFVISLGVVPPEFNRGEPIAAIE